MNNTSTVEGISNSIVQSMKVFCVKFTYKDFTERVIVTALDIDHSHNLVKKANMNTPIEIIETIEIELGEVWHFSSERKGSATI